LQLLLLDGCFWQLTPAPLHISSSVPLSVPVHILDHLFLLYPNLGRGSIPTWDFGGDVREPRSQADSVVAAYSVGVKERCGMPRCSTNSGHMLLEGNRCELRDLLSTIFGGVLKYLMLEV
jgi:hypothetical protein